jgi:hypothetical protein
MARKIPSPLKRKEIIRAKTWLFALKWHEKSPLPTGERVRVRG